jgi:hypothetical protein
VVPAARHRGQDHDHGRETATSPPSGAQATIRNDPRPPAQFAVTAAKAAAGRQDQSRHLNRSRHPLAIGPISPHPVHPDAPGALGNPDGQQPGIAKP